MAQGSPVGSCEVTTFPAAGSHESYELNEFQGDVPYVGTIVPHVGTSVPYELLVRGPYEPVCPLWLSQAPYRAVRFLWYDLTWRVLALCGGP